MTKEDLIAIRTFFPEWGKSHEMLVDISLDRNTTFHLTWELEEFKKYMNSWKLPKILDYIKEETKYV